MGQSSPLEAGSIAVEDILIARVGAGVGVLPEGLVSGRELNVSL